MIAKAFLTLVVITACGTQLKALQILKLRSASQRLLGAGLLLFCLSVEIACVAALALDRSIDTWSSALRALIEVSAFGGIACIILAVIVGSSDKST